MGAGGRLFDPRERLLALKAMIAVTRWRELRAVEVQFERVGNEEFDGEGPALPVVRETIASAKAKLEAVRRTLAGMGEAFEFEEPGDDDLAEVRKMYERAVELES